jgi:uncharacterized membrane protein
MDSVKNPVRQKVDAIADIHHAGEQRVPHHQRFVEAITHHVGQPRTLYVLLAFVAAWVCVNTMTSLRWDPPPFSWLQGIVALLGLLTTTVVLITQDRLLRRADRRSQLDLHINLLAEEKIAKLVALIEELRRDLPSVQNRNDPEATAMAQGTDPREVLEQIEERLDSEDGDGTNHVNAPRPGE